MHYNESCVVRQRRGKTSACVIAYALFIQVCHHHAETYTKNGHKNVIFLPISS